MTFQMHDGKAFIAHLCALPQETPWIEFKSSAFNPETVGKYVSGLANAAMLARKQHAFMVWGVEDETHSIIGTSLNLSTKKIGSTELLFWLSQKLRPKINLSIKVVDCEGKSVEILAIEPGYQQPVSFDGQEYVRVGSRLRTH